MPQIAWAIFVILCAIAILHLYWAFGGLWPGKDEKTLTQTVIGATGITHMPPKWLTVLVAILIFMAALFPLIWSGIISSPVPDGLVRAAMWVLTFIFIARGIAGYLPFFHKSNAEQPFATLNRNYYSPLCIVIGCGYLGLIHLARI